jgi:hypothetical protein
MTDFDLSSIKVSDTFDVEITHPRTGSPLLAPGDVVTDEATGQPAIDPATNEPKRGPGKPVTVTVYGPGTAVFAKAKAAERARSLAKLRRKGTSKDDTPEEEAEATAAFLSSCTKSFNNFNYHGLPNDEQGFRACYADPKMGWFTQQVNAEMGDWANFTTSSSKT